MPATTIPCPICKTAVGKSGPEFPFCSPRCRLIDLGKWASGEYRISTPLKDGEDRAGSRSEGEDDVA